jgi:hypothetical protein
MSEPSASRSMLAAPVGAFRWVDRKETPESVETDMLLTESAAATSSLAAVATKTFCSVRPSTTVSMAYATGLAARGPGPQLSTFHSGPVAVAYWSGAAPSPTGNGLTAVGGSAPGAAEPVVAANSTTAAPNPSSALAMLVTRDMGELLSLHRTVGSGGPVLPGGSGRRPR